MESAPTAQGSMLGIDPKGRRAPLSPNIIQ